MTDIIKIEGQEVNRIEYQGSPVITFKMVDELHERPEGTAKNSFARNKDKFEEGYHYYSVPFGEWSEIFGGTFNVPPKGGHTGNMLCITGKSRSNGTPVQQLKYYESVTQAM